MADKSKEEIKQATLEQVPTQFGIQIKLEDGSAIGQLELEVAIYNKLLKIEKAVC